jgi:acyl-CoA synthetase (AMP-forming)/AMP-acid ligase II
MSAFIPSEFVNMVENLNECNPFLSRWRKISNDRSREGAIFGSEGQVLQTFGGIQSGAEKWAERLSLLGGDGSQPRVMLRVGNGPEWPEVILGTWLAGGVLIPVEPSLEDSAVTEMESLCGATVRVEDGRDGLVATKLPASAPPLLLADLFKITSGTTSGRRAIAFSAAQWLADVDNLGATMGIGPEDRNLALIPFAHSYGLSSLVGMLIGRGVPLIPWSDPLPRALGSVLACSGATVFPGVPAMFRGLAGTGFRSPTLRLCLSAGAALPARDAQDFHRITGLKIHSFYGASECGGICYDRSEDPGVPEGFVGEAVEGVNLETATAEGGLALTVRGPAVGTAYLPSREGDVLQGGMFCPPDLLESTSGGFRITGRDSDFINVGGRKVNPAEVEQALRTHPAVEDVVAFGVTQSRGEVVAVCVVSHQSERELKTHAGSLLPAWKLPKHWVFLEKIPVNARGKVSRKDLAAQFG